MSSPTSSTVPARDGASFAWRGRVAFVSGGASGIGLGLAGALAARGVRIALSDVRREPLEAACAQLRRDGADVQPFVLDVADRSAMYATADAVERHFGKVHFVFNNAGVGEVGTPLDQVPDPVFDWVIDVNLRGVFNGIKAFVPKLRRHGEGGHIVNTSSMAGLVTEPGWKTGVYSATKMGIVALSVDLRDALADTGIGVSVLCPGLVRTGIGANATVLRPLPHEKPPEVPAMLAEAGMPPAAAAQIVLSGIEDNHAIIVTNPELWPSVARFHDGIRAAFEAAARARPRGGKQ